MGLFAQRNLPFSFVFRKLRVAQGLLFLRCCDPGRPKDGVLTHYEEQMLEVALWIRCCAACKGYSAKPGYSNTSASAAGNGDCNEIVIEYNVPEQFRKQSGKRIPTERNVFRSSRLHLRGRKGNDPTALLGPKAHCFASLVGSEGTDQF